MRKFFPFLSILTIISLAACTGWPVASTSLPATVPAPQQQILPTDSLPFDETPTPIPSQAAPITTEAVDLPLETPTIDPTYFNFPTNTPTPTLDPSLILLRIVSPGPMSKVVSPIEHFVVHIAAAYTGLARIELIGENGASLYLKEYKTFSNIGYYTRVDENIPFIINGVAEVARLQISTFDEKGRLQAFNSVRLLLQAVGENEFTPPYSVQDRTILSRPLRNDITSGGNVNVTGVFQPANDQPVTLELIDAEGNILGSSLITFDATNRNYQQFSTVIAYSVKALVPVQLVIRQSDNRIDGLAYLYSIPIAIGP